MRFLLDNLDDLAGHDMLIERSRRRIDMAEPPVQRQSGGVWPVTTALLGLIGRIIGRGTEPSRAGMRGSL